MLSETSLRRLFVLHLVVAEQQSVRVLRVGAGFIGKQYVVIACGGDRDPSTPKGGIYVAVALP